MANISKLSTGVRALGIPGDYEQIESKLAEACDVGDVVRLDPTNGTFTGANGTSGTEAAWVGVLLSGGVAGEWCTAVEKGELAGFDLSGLNFGAAVYLSDTDKTLADTAGTTSAIVGRVYPARASGATLDKVLKVGV